MRRGIARASATGRGGRTLEVTGADQTPSAGTSAAARQAPAPPPEAPVGALVVAVEALVALVAFGVYLATLAPTVTWRNGGADGAELATAAYVWGVAHPPGYPLYLSLVRLFQVLPVGDLAHRAALVSAAAGAAASALTAAAVFRLAGGPREAQAATIGAAYAGLSLAFGPLFWSQAVVAEVYTLTAALLAWVILATVWWTERPTRERTAWLAVGVALLASHQPTLGIVLLPLLAIGWRRWQGGALAGRDAALGLALLLLAPLVLATVWLRAALHPPLSWGEATSFGRWLAHVTAQDYRPYLLARPLPDELPRVPYAAALLARQGGWPWLALGLFGLAHLWTERRALAAVLLTVGALSAVWAVLYNAEGGEVYLLPLVLVLAVGAGLGATGALQAAQAPQGRRWRGLAVGAVPLLLGGCVAWQVGSAWSAVDVSGDTTARRWGEQTLAEAPPGATLETDRDEETFVLWYLHVAEGMRPDVRIVDTRLAALPWYREQEAQRARQAQQPQRAG